MTRAPVAALTALLTASCGASLLKLPPGPGLPASDARDALAEATNQCLAVTSITVEIAVSGSVGGQRLRARIVAGLAPPDLARLEADAFGQAVFTFVAQRGDAALHLQRDSRFLEHGPPEAVLEALTGVPLDPATLRTTLTGCTMVPDWREAQQLGENWRLIPDKDASVYLHRNAPREPWRVVATIRRDPTGGEWRAEYRNPIAGLPRDIRLTSSDGKRFNLRLILSQLETNVTIDPEAFTLRRPVAAEPITLSELRKSGLLGVSSGGDGR